LTFLLFLFLLTSCVSGTPAATGVVSTSQPTAIPEPTVGPTPTLPAPLVILIIPVDINEAQSKAYQTAVYDLAQSVGYRFQVRNKLTLKDIQLEPTLKVVIALPPDPGIVSLATAAPDAQFLAINIPGIQPGGNISVLGNESARIEHVAFMAGYIGAMVTGDFFQVGAILRKDDPESPVIQAAFEAGRTYFCGLCIPLDWYTPYTYPAFVEIPADAKENEYSAYADILVLQKKVGTIFIQPGLDTPELIQYLSTVGVLMIGTQTPTKTVNGWIVTLQPDYLKAMQAAFPDLAAGRGGKAFPAPLSFTDVNQDLFTQGKQNDAQKVLDDLVNGFISSGVNQ
jgi:hypothetical protein